jgi:hypothetical protein
MSKKPAIRRNNLVIQDLKSETLIYDLDANKAFCLNETSALVWQLSDGSKSVSEISREIGKKLNQPANEDLVWLALDQLKKEGLMEENQEVESPFVGMSRREVIRKVGLGTMIALPIVTGLVAPTAAMAQSAGVAVACSCPNGQVANATSCTNSPECGGGQTCTGVNCNAGGNNCGTLNGTCV